jgi:hypothetical protein
MIGGINLVGTIVGTMQKDSRLGKADNGIVAPA